MSRASSVNACPRAALWLYCICHAMALLLGLGVYLPRFAHADEGLGLEDTYEPGYDESNYYGAPWYSKGQEELDRMYGRRDGSSDYSYGPSSAERRRIDERREAEQQEANMRLYREHVAAHEARCQQQLPALTEAVRIHRESFELLQSQVRYNADVAKVAYTADTFAETYGAAGEVAQQIKAAEAAFEAQLDASEMLAPPLGPEQVDALGMAIQGGPFETQASMDGFEALILTSVQHQEVSFQVASLQTYTEQRRALLDSAALFITGADQSFAGFDATTGYSLLGVAQEGLDIALSAAAFTPAGATFSIARTVGEYVAGYDFITGAPINFDAVDAVGMAMVLFPGGKPFSKLAKVFGKVAKSDTRLGTKVRRLWGCLTDFKDKNAGPEIMRDLERTGSLRDVAAAERAAQEYAITKQVVEAKVPKDLPLRHFSESAAKINRGEETHAGRALRKHGNRKDTSVYPPPQGDSAAMNRRAQDIVEEILYDPRSILEHQATDRSGRAVIKIIHPDGRGVAYYVNGNFKGLLEPN